MASQTSLPSWERGLKYPLPNGAHHKHLVAPLVGAWIEIFPKVTSCHFYLVAPLVGAWIEIYKVILKASEPTSLPSWERGLKFRQKRSEKNGKRVAPLVGAWIEIQKCKINRDSTIWSLPSWERGLKYIKSW